MRKLGIFFFLFLLSLMLFQSALSEEMAFTVLPEEIRPGKVERISFSSPEAGQAQLELLNVNGESVFVIRKSLLAAQGVNHLTWDGLDPSGDALAPGQYYLLLRIGENTIQEEILVGEPSPQILSISAANEALDGQPWRFRVEVNQTGVLSVRVRISGDDPWQTVFSQEIPAGESDGEWDGSLNGELLPSGGYTAQFMLTDASGFTGTAKQVSFTLETVPTPAPTPTPRIVKPGATAAFEGENSYWTMDVGVMDEAAIWEIMTQPLTVIDGNQKEVYRLRKTPDNTISKENVVGEITYASQGVHVLETLDNGWTLVEAYNSSYGPDCASRRGYGVTDDLIRGYVKTSLLKTITPRTDYGLLIDKLEQKMYIFSDGKCIGELLVSTGLNNDKQSWNETPSGEFVMISRMGGFAAGNLWCAYGMRINGGCAIHEVPYIGNENTPADRRDYSSTVKLLGRKASHGCIRVQKAANEQGQNIKWLWDNIKVNTKVLIWDDTGRIRPYPVADDYELYYNPVGGKYYHENQNCPSVKSRYLPLTPFTYGDLDSDEAFTGLLPCPKCTTLMRKTQIDEMNRLENGGN